MLFPFPLKKARLISPGGEEEKEEKKKRKRKEGKCQHESNGRMKRKKPGRKMESHIFPLSLPIVSSFPVHPLFGKDFRWKVYYLKEEN